MKKITCSIVVLIGCFFGAFAQEGSFSTRLDAAISSGSQSNVLSLLDVFGGDNDAVYTAAVKLLPKQQRLDYIQTLPSFSSRQQLIVTYLPKGAALNAALVAFYSEKQRSTKPALRFDEGSATKEECAAFYELVLKNVEANQKTVNGLGTIKGQVLKLQDIE